MPRTIEYYFSMPSPWAYLGHATFVELAKRHGAAINYKPVPLGRVFSTALTDMRALVDERSADIHVESLPTVLCDAQLLRSAVSHLLSNAIKFVPEQTRPCVRIFAEPADLPCELCARLDSHARHCDR